MWFEASFWVRPEHEIFLSPRLRRVQPLCYRFQGHPSVKDAFEALGIPHPEVSALTINGVSARFQDPLRPGDKVCLDWCEPESRLLREPLKTPFRFVLDEHLNKLMIWMRLLGFDTILNKAWDDPHLAAISHREKRILLTRDVGLLKRAVVVYGSFVRNTDPRHQLTEIISRFGLERQIQPFRLCTVCNASLLPVQKEEVAGRVAQRTYFHYTRFFECSHCQRVYWQGSHYQNILKQLNRLGFNP